MKKNDIVRAWRDPKFRRSLSAEQRAQLPAHPAVDVDDDILTSVSGGCCPPGTTTAICSPCPPRHCF